VNQRLTDRIAVARCASHNAGNATRGLEVDIKTADVGRGASWLFDGFGYFTRSTVAWLGVTVLMALIWLAVHFVPLVGAIAMHVLMPVFLGGLMLGCRAQDSGQPLTVAHLFEGFSKGTSQLALVGVLYFLGLVVIVFVALILVAVFLGGVGALQQLQQSDPAALIGVLASIAVPVLVAAALVVPLLMLVWFAPALIVFDGKDALEAMRLSFRGCLLNVVPFLLYGVVGLVLSVLASIPFLLGWLVLFPMVTASVYMSYKEIFGGAAAPAA
jgi:uncharacterized membrane protein